MNVLLVQAIYLSGLLSVHLLASDVELTRSVSPLNPEESGVVTWGTIFDISNDRIVVLPSGSREPIRYSHGEGTVYVDESGKPIILTVVRSGVEVTVFYSQEEEQRMANKVIVGTPPASREVLIDC